MHPSYGTYNCSCQKTTVQLYNTKDHAIIIKKGTAVTRMVAANEVPEMVVTNGAAGALQTQMLAKEGHTELTIEERRKILFKELELSGLASWTKENKERALDLLAEYHDIFTLEDGEMGCTKAAEHKIEVMDPKLSKRGQEIFHQVFLRRLKIIWNTCLMWVQSSLVNWHGVML